MSPSSRPLRRPPRTIAARLESVLRHADDLAGAWGARARASTTPARERAILRLFGVGGLDRNEVSLASAVVERHVGGSSERLAAGLALPFAVALLEYDIAPSQLALDVASGAIDLGFEAELLERPDRRAAAEAEVRRLAGAALERIDANRVARLETLDVLGDAPRPWLGVPLAASTLATAPAEAAAAVDAGADLVRIRIPAIRELILKLHDRGLEPGYWHPRPGERGPAGGGAVGTRAGLGGVGTRAGLGGPGAVGASGTSAAAGEGAWFDRPPDDEDPADVPAGSQRALATLRARVDEAAASAGRYVRLGTTAPALAAPEQALVAALERLDVVEADAIDEIVAGGVDPDRALADHAFGHRLLQRAGSMVLLGPGPLVVAPDLARGLPSDPATRAGRAFAMQALAVALAQGDGLTRGHLAAGGLVPWLIDERDPATQALAAVAVRRLAWPDLTLAFEEPDLPGPTGARWAYIVALALAVAGPTALVLRRATGAAAVTAAEETTRAAAHVAAEIADRPEAVLERPPIAAQAEALLTAAEATLAGLADEGWSTVLGEVLGDEGGERLGADAVAERSEGFDPLG
jgi:hypothetical protein